MTLQGWLQFGVVAGLFVVLTPPLGAYMARVYSADTPPGERVFGPLDRAIYRLCGIDASREQRWTTYAA